MELKSYLEILRRWAWLVIAGCIIAGLSAFYISKTQEPVYRATAQLLVLEGGSSVDAEYNSLLLSERLASSYAERLMSYDVLSGAIKTLNLETDPADVVEDIQVQLIGNTQLISLSVDHTDPRVARDLANEIPEIFAQKNSAQQLDRFSNIKNSLEDELKQMQVEIAAAESVLQSEINSAEPNKAVMERESDHLLRLRETYNRLLRSLEDIRIAEVKSLNNLIIDEYARLPEEPIRPRVLANTLLAVVVGGMTALGVVFLIEYLDDSVKTAADIEAVTGLSTLGMLQQLKVHHASDTLVVELEPRSPAAEAYRQIRTNLQFTSVDKPSGTFLITSANMGEGKTTVAINLAVALAQAGKRVLLVDTDMRRPMLHTLLAVDGSLGLSNMIVRGREDERFIQGTMIPNLRVMTAGRLPPNPAELLGSERMREVLLWLKQQADFVVFDSPPVLAVTDSVVLSRLVDTTLFVACMGQTRLADVETAVSQIQAVDSAIAGVILNKVKANGRYGYHYTYQYRARYAPEQPLTWKDRLQAINSTIFQYFS
ncbi:MAG: polysaccharide biosynthesis tyrosine autokinase [Chloroflexota bacterium]